MPFEAVLGQSTAVGTLERALRSGKVHHAYRFEGPNGVGKEMAAFALAQALVCETPPPRATSTGPVASAALAPVRSLARAQSPTCPSTPMS